MGDKLIPDESKGGFERLFNFCFLYIHYLFNNFTETRVRERGRIFHVTGYNSRGHLSSCISVPAKFWPSQRAISACKAANSSSSGVGFAGAGRVGCRPAGTCTEAAGAVVAG